MNHLGKETKSNFSELLNLFGGENTTCIKS